jgi:hypothetical protein
MRKKSADPNKRVEMTKQIQGMNERDDIDDAGRQKKQQERDIRDITMQA